MTRFYAVMCVAGFVLPYSALIFWFLDGNSKGVGDIGRNVFANGLSTMGWADVVITAIVVNSFARTEAFRMKMGSVAAPILGTCLVGPSFGLPLFLFMREKARMVRQQDAKLHG